MNGRCERCGEDADGQYCRECGERMERWAAKQPAGFEGGRKLSAAAFAEFGISRRRGELPAKPNGGQTR